jgi:hypothetical protein
VSSGGFAHSTPSPCHILGQGTALSCGSPEGLVRWFLVFLGHSFFLPAALLAWSLAVSSQTQGDTGHRVLVGTLPPPGSEPHVTCHTVFSSVLGTFCEAVLLIKCCAGRTSLLGKTACVGESLPVVGTLGPRAGSVPALGSAVAPEVAALWLTEAISSHLPPLP